MDESLREGAEIPPPTEEEAEFLKVKHLHGLSKGAAKKRVMSPGKALFAAATRGGAVPPPPTPPTEAPPVDMLGKLNPSLLDGDIIAIYDINRGTFSDSTKQCVQQ